MKTTFAIDIPACSTTFCAAVQSSFTSAGYHTAVTTDPSAFSAAEVIQYLLPAIEPAAPKLRLYIQIGNADASVLDKTLLTECFVMEIIGRIQTCDLFPLECLVTSCIGHEVTLTYLRQMKAPSKVMKSASAAAKKSDWIEKFLGTPDAHELLSDFADKLIATGTCR